MRAPDYLSILPLAIHGWRAKPVPTEIGQGDCAQMTLDVCAQIGVDLAPPAWSSLKAAVRVHKKLGGIAGHLSKVLPEIERHQALCGDIVVLGNGAEGLGNCGLLCAGQYWTIQLGEGLICVDWGRVQAEHETLRVYSTAPQIAGVAA
jgi:hypothetical protein